jgi:hypothetical protein
VAPLDEAHLGLSVIPWVFAVQLYYSHSGWFRLAAVIASIDGLTIVIGLLVAIVLWVFLRFVPAGTSLRIWLTHSLTIVGVRGDPGATRPDSRGNNATTEEAGEVGKQRFSDVTPGTGIHLHV